MTLADECCGCGKITPINTPEPVVIKEFFFCSAACAAVFDTLVKWRPDRHRKPQ